VLSKRALAVLPNANEWVGQGESPLLDQCRRQDPPNSHGHASALTEMRAEQSGVSREPGIVAQALKLCYCASPGRACLSQRSAIFACAAPVCRGACPMSFTGSLHLSGQQEWHGSSTVRAPEQCSLFACAAPVCRGACPMSFTGSLHLSGQQEWHGSSTVRAPEQCSLLWTEFAARNV